MLPYDMVAAFRRLGPGIVLPLYDRLSGRRIWEEWKSLRRLQRRPAEELEDRAGAKLKSLLIHAGAHVPYYRDLFADAGADPGTIARASDLERFPVTTKARLRAAFPFRAIADNLPAGRRYWKRTSGSSGLPLEFYADRSAIDRWLASFLFFREWAGSPLWLTRLQIATPPHFSDFLKNEAFRAHSPGRSPRLRRWLLGENVVRLSGPDLTLSGFLARVRDSGRRGYFVFAFPSYAAWLAARILDSGSDLPSLPRVVMSYGETLTPPRQDLIERAFHCRVVNHYSSLEVLHMAQTCPDNPGLLHVNSERAILRVVRQDGTPARPGEMGRILVTDLTNEVMPFINYETGDWGAAGPPCPCGRGFPTLTGIEGRGTEFLRLPSGRIVSPGCFGSFFMRPGGAHPHIWEFQAVQRAPGSLDLIIVPAGSFSAAISDRIARDLEAWLGPGMSVTIKLADRIDSEPSGKRPVIRSGPAAG
jgi:phenylacetate-CoA ligase